MMNPALGVIQTSHNPIVHARLENGYPERHINRTDSDDNIKAHYIITLILYPYSILIRIPSTGPITAERYLNTCAVQIVVQYPIPNIPRYSIDRNNPVQQRPRKRGVVIPQTPC